MATLTWKNIDTPQNEIRLVTRKTGRQITVPIAPPLRAHIETVSAPNDAGDPLHPTAHGVITRTGRAGGLSNGFAELLAAAGLREKATHRRTGKGRTAKRLRQALSFHSLRDMATTLLHEAGIPD